MSSRCGQNRAKADCGTPRLRWAGAAASLAGGASVVAAAERSGVHERTVRRWLKRPAFVRRVSELRQQMVGEAVGRMSRSMSSAAGALDKLLTSRDPGTRLRAARAILELAVRLRDHDEIACRLADLERRIAAGDVGGGAA